MHAWRELVGCGVAAVTWRQSVALTAAVDRYHAIDAAYSEANMALARDVIAGHGRDALATMCRELSQKRTVADMEMMRAFREDVVRR